MYICTVTRNNKYMKNLKKYICTKEFIAKTESGKRVKIEVGKPYFGSYDFEHLDAGHGFLFLKVDGRSQKVYIQSGPYWTDHFKYFGHCSEDIEATSVEIVKRARIVKQ